MVKDALSFAGPFAFLSMRFALATVLLAPALLWARQRAAVDGPLARAGGVLGALLCAGYGFQTAGLQLTTPARAAFITGLSVVVVPMLTGLALHRPVARGVWVGVCLATAGLALLSLGPELLAGHGRLVDPQTLIGDLLVLGCAFVFGGHVFMAGEYAPRFEAFSLTTIQLAVATALATLVAAGFEQPRLDQLGPILPAAAFTGVFATVLAFTIQLRAQRFTSATHTALVFATEPVFGALFAYLLAGEVLAPPAVVGCLLILAGMLVAQFGETKAVQRAAPAVQRAQ
jgi:drug/metabolite transporter (DMT)-like permease